MADEAKSITLEDLTTTKVDGTGAFDKLMQATAGHIQVEFTSGRIRGADYAQVYLAALTPVLQNAVVFLLQKDEAANKAALVAAQIELTKAQGDLVKIEISRENLTRGLLEAQTNMLKEQLNNEVKRGKILDNDILLSAKNVERATAEIAHQVQLTKNSAQELLNLVAQECLLKAQYDLALLQKLQTTAQTTLIQQKTSTEKAQISAGGVEVDSVIGRQKGLYVAQTDGFKRDAEQKAAKLLVDTWNVRRTTDPGTVADSTNMLNDATIGRAITNLLKGAGA